MTTSHSLDLRWQLYARASRTSTVGSALIAVTVLILFFFCIPFAQAQTGFDSNNQEADERALRVQLQWSDQAQFSGFYVAKARRFFEQEGLDVTLIPGGPGINPIEELQQGRADVAVAWLNNAWKRSSANASVTNIGQIFSANALSIICRISSGVFTSRDVEGKKIGVWGIGDEVVVRELIHSFGLDQTKIELVTQAPQAADLISGKLPCATVMLYNEYWALLESGIDASDLIIIDPDAKGVPHIEDGLYVNTDQLDSAHFQETLVRFMRALRRGWDLSRQSPTLAVETVMRVAPTLDREHQRHMAENIVTLINTDTASFGLFDLQDYENVRKAHQRFGFDQQPPKMLWTHQIWEQLTEQDGADSPIHVSTRHYVSNVTSSTAFYLLLCFGVFIYSLSGVLEAINRGYDVWGRLSLAFLSGLGGSTLRDFLIGGDRLPPSYIKDLTMPIGILVVVVLVSIATAVYRDIHHTKAFKRLKLYADVGGFSVLAIAGALYSISAGLPWLWAPICAALSCAGGGVLRDIVVNQEPTTFKGVFYEEIAVVGALFFIGGLMIANTFEQTALPVYITVVASIALIIVCRLLVYRYHIRYPKIFNVRET